MKLVKFCILFFALAFCMGVTAQNVSINVLTLNSGQVFQNGTVFLQIDISNTDNTNSVPAYKMRPQISFPAAIVTIPATGHVLPDGWTMPFNSGSVIRLSNGTDVIPPNTTRTILIAVQGVNLGGPSTISANLLFSNGVAPGTASGTGTPGDVTADNTSTSTVEVLPAPACAISVSAAAGTVLCNGGTTTLTATASGATGAVEYSLNGGAFQSSNIFTVNAAGSPYTVTAREVSNTSCSANSSAVTVSQPTAVSAAAAVTTPIAVFGGTGSITVTASGGTGSKTYVITSGTTTNTTGAASGVFTGLLAGSYTFTATDANGCAGVSSAVTLNNPAACTIAVSASAGTITCNGGTTTLTATATGANNTVEYSLNGGAYQSSNSFTVNAAGSPYTITAREIGNTSCNATSSAVTVSQPAAIVASATAGTIACNGGSTTLTVTASGGTGSFEYSLNGGAYQSSNSFTVNAAGSPYTVTVRDASLCTRNSNVVTVSQPAVVAAPVINSTNNGNGTFTLTASGFTGSLLWNPGGETTASILVSASGNYCVAQTVSGCTSTTTCQTVTIGSAIADPAVGQMFFTTLADASQSANGLLFTQDYKLKVPVYNLNQFTAVSSSAINLKINLGTKVRLDAAYNLATAPLSQYFSFTSAIVADSQVITGVQIAEIPADFAGIAVFQVEGLLSCTSQISSAIVITNSSASITDEDLNNNNATLQYTLPVTVSATPVHVTCNGAANGNITVVTSPGVTYVITNAANAVVTAPFAPGVYSVTASATGDAPLNNTCSNTTTVTITEPVVLTVPVIGTTPSICNGGNSGTITVSAAGGTAPYSYAIAGPAINVTGQFTGVFTGLTAGTYTITATDANGCTATSTAVVGQPTGTNPDLSLGSDITGSMFASNGTSQTIVYNISEIAGNPAVGDTVRITKVAGFDINFNDALTSTVVTPTTYTLDNPNWKIDNSDPAFVSIIRKADGGGAGAGTIYCGQTVFISVTLTRNTTDISTFPLSARVRRANSELNLSNNFNSIIFTAD